MLEFSDLILLLL